jgi:hypothetical protein
MNFLYVLESMTLLIDEKNSQRDASVLYLGVKRSKGSIYDEQNKDFFSFIE